MKLLDFGQRSAALVCHVTAQLNYFVEKMWKVTRAYFESGAFSFWCFPHLDTLASVSKCNPVYAEIKGPPFPRSSPLGEALAALSNYFKPTQLPTDLLHHSSTLNWLGQKKSHQTCVSSLVRTSFTPSRLKKRKVGGKLQFISFLNGYRYLDVRSFFFILVVIELLL